MNVFVTGGTGNIGSHVVMELVNRGHDVTVLARNPSKVSLFLDHPHIRMVEGLLDDLAVIKTALVGQEVVLHIALNYQEERGWKAVLDDTVPTIQLAQAAIDAGVMHFIYTSSTSVNDTLYSLDNRDPSQTIVLGPESAPTVGSHYGATKSACEVFLSAFSYQSNLRVNVIRPGYTFGNPVEVDGPIQSDTRFFDLVKQAKRNETIELDAGDGTQFIASSQIAKLYVAVVESSVNRKIYYGLSKQFITWAEIAKETIERLGSSSELVLHDSGHKGGLFWDVSLMEKDFGLLFDPWPELLAHIDETIRRLDAAEGS